MKPILFILSLLFSSLSLFLFQNQLNSQSCFHTDNSIIPISTYQENSYNAYLQFTDSTLIRAPHIPALNFVSSGSSYKVDISFKAKITGTGSSAQTLVSQFCNNVGWYISYNISGYKRIKFYLTNPNTGSWAIYDIDTLRDTDWHTYRIVFDKNLSHLDTYVDGSATHNHTSVSWSYTPDTSSALAIGAQNVSIYYGEANLGAHEYLIGYFDDFLAKVNDTTVMNVNFNWGGGQFALDSTGFFTFDRNYSDGTNPSLNLLAFTLGCTFCADKRDPTWVSTGTPATNYSTLGNGFWHWRESGVVESLEAWEANSVIYNDNLYVTGDHNRVNGSVTSQGDASYGISMWDATQNKWVNVGTGLEGYGLYAGTWTDNQSLYNTNYLVVTGVFQQLHNHTTVNNIALWDGSNWSALTDTGGTGLTVNSALAGFITTTYNGDLVVGGSFSKAGGTSAKNIARWINVPSGFLDQKVWDKFGDGLDGPVSALVVFNDELYAGGSFVTANNGQIMFIV